MINMESIKYSCSLFIIKYDTFPLLYKFPFSVHFYPEQSYSNKKNNGEKHAEQL